MGEVKDLLENEELVNYLVDGIEDFPEDAAVTYEVWAIGYNSDNEIADAELLIAAFDNPDEAVNVAKQLTAADIIYKAAEQRVGQVPSENVAYVSIEVETVVDDEYGGTMSVGTIYMKEVSLIEEDEYTEVVPVTADDYTLLEDGSLEIDCDVLKDFNKNDQVQLWFTDEDGTPILTYNIISKTTSNKYICEFVY
jgi:hypothetical protein